MDSSAFMTNGANKIGFMTNGAKFCNKVISFGVGEKNLCYYKVMSFATKSWLHPENLAKVFDHILAHDMHLNPEKCFFGGGRKIYGFHGHQRGIEANRINVK